MNGEHTHLPDEFDPRCPVCIDAAADEVAARGLGIEAALDAWVDP